ELVPGPVRVAQIIAVLENGPGQVGLLSPLETQVVQWVVGGRAGRGAGHKVGIQHGTGAVAVVVHAQTAVLVVHIPGAQVPAAGGFLEGIDDLYDAHGTHTGIDVTQLQLVRRAVVDCHLTEAIVDLDPPRRVGTDNAAAHIDEAAAGGVD